MPFDVKLCLHSQTGLGLHVFDRVCVSMNGEDEADADKEAEEAQLKRLSLKTVVDIQRL